MSFNDELKKLLSQVEKHESNPELEAKANKFLAPEGFNEENSFVCCSCNDRKHMLYSMPMKFIKADGHLLLPFKLIGTNPPPPANATERMCADCYHRLYNVLGDLGEMFCARAMMKLMDIMEVRRKERAERN